MPIEYFVIDENTSDGHHTFKELYDYRMLYNAALFNEWAQFHPNKINPVVCKSKWHSDGELVFGGGWFIVVAQLPEGQISNHYKMEYWDMFQIPQVDRPPAYDGHTPQEAAERLRKFLQHG